MALKTDYKDYEFQQGETLRKYNKIENDDGTISLEDVTDYSVIGDTFSAVDFNKTNEEVNKINAQSDDKINELAYSGLLVDGETYSGIASDKGIKLRKVVGNTVQEATNGYQLFDQSKLPTASAGGATVTNNGDGSFTISGSGNISNEFNTSYNIYNSECKKLFKKGDLSVKMGGGLHIDDTLPRFQVIIRTSNGVLKKGITNTTETITIDAEEFDNGEYCEIRFYGSIGAAIKAITIKPMLYQDGDGTWEQFTGGQPAPSPDYPMDIQNFEINEINSRTNQLFDQSKLPTASAGGATVTNNGDGSFTISGSGNLTTGFAITYVYSKEDAIKIISKPGTYHLNSDFNNLRPYFIFGLYSSGIPVKYLTSVGIFSITINDDDIDKLASGEYQLDIIITAAKDSPIIAGTFKPMIYQDGDGTWEPFKLSTVETSLKLAKDDTFVDGVITRKRAKITFDGSSDENWALYNSNGQYSGFFINMTSMKIGVRQDGACNRFNVDKIYQSEKPGIWLGANNNIIYFVNVNPLYASSVSEWRTWLQSNPVEVEYELAEPTTEELQVPTIPSYYPNTNVWTDNEVPPIEIKWELLANSDNTLEIEKKQNKILIGADPIPSNELGVDGDIYIYIEE